MPKPLNEGRGRDPGDTPDRLHGVTQGAQRRPGSRPRRHGESGGASDNASLNEGRGRDPGDTSRVMIRVRRRARSRSTKAGVETPATQLGDPGMVSSPVLRSTKAGVETPATPPSGPRSATLIVTLNEGRGRDPGDTSGLASRDMTSCFRLAQRRPGSRPRRHKRRSTGSQQAVRDRSTKAGVETPATPGGPVGGDT